MTVGKFVGSLVLGRRFPYPKPRRKNGLVFGQSITCHVFDSLHQWVEAHEFFVITCMEFLWTRDHLLPIAQEKREKKKKGEKLKEKSLHQRACLLIEKLTLRELAAITNTNNFTSIATTIRCWVNQEIGQASSSLPSATAARQRPF